MVFFVRWVVTGYLAPMKSFCMFHSEVLGWCKDILLKQNKIEYYTAGMEGSKYHYLITITFIFIFVRTNIFFAKQSIFWAYQQVY